MVSSCGRFVIVYNGEIYSHDEIAADLCAAGRTLRGHSDTEVVLEACALWGVKKALPRLIGMFAFALYDRQTRDLVLVRDRLGIKPIYWGQVDRVFLFGSELKALRAAEGWQPRLDRDALSAFLRYSYIPTPHSIYQGIHKLEPGMTLTLKADGTYQKTRYWDLHTIVVNGLATPADLSQDEAIEQLEPLLADAVKRRMVSDVPIGTLLSGGIDSSLVTALAAEQSPQPLHTFAIGFAKKSFDEAPYARAVANHIGTNHTELYLDPSDAFSLVNKLPLVYDEPFADSSQLPSMMVSEMTKRHVTVALSGDGGDEIFAGYDHYRHRLGPNIYQKVGIVPPHLRWLMANILLRIQDTARPNKFTNLLPYALRSPLLTDKVSKLIKLLMTDNPGRTYQALVGRFEWHDAVLGGHEAKTIPDDFMADATFSDFLTKMQFLDTTSYLHDDILTKMDRASMAFSLEVRVPLLDHRVVEMAFQMPRDLMIHQGQSKWLLRQILYKRVPPHLIDRPKMGFGVPLEGWLRDSWRPWAEALLDPVRLKKQGLFVPELVWGRWQNYLTKRKGLTAIWNMLMAQAWLEANPEVTL